jgi:hypothetical protein
VLAFLYIKEISQKTGPNQRLCDISTKNKFSKVLDTLNIAQYNHIAQFIGWLARRSSGVLVGGGAEGAPGEEFTIVQYIFYRIPVFL